MCLLFIMVTTVALAVILRYVFRTGIHGSFEAVAFIYVWIVFLGSVTAIKEGAHIGLDLFVNRLHGKIKTCVLGFGDLLVMAFLVIQIVYGCKFMIDSYGQFFSPVMGVPLYLVYAVFPLSGILMLFEMVKVLRRHLREDQ